MVINSEPYESAPTAQLPVSVAQLNLLEHASHIDTSKMVKLTKMETVGVIESTPSAHKGAISDALKRMIIAKINEHGIMPQDQMNLLLANFAPDDPPAPTEKPKGRILK
jgi:hypothetical protein